MAHTTFWSLECQPLLALIARYERSTNVLCRANCFSPMAQSDERVSLYNIMKDARWRRIPADLCCCRRHGQGPAAQRPRQRRQLLETSERERRGLLEDRDQATETAARERERERDREMEKHQETPKGKLRGKKEKMIQHRNLARQEKQKKDLDVHCLLCGLRRSCSWLKITNS